jgi:hypothetical protein
VELWPAYLLVPVAAWLGRRYGRHGIVTVAVGTAATLLPSFELGPFGFGGMPALYVIALWVSIACAAPDPLRALMGGGRLFRSPSLFICALILLPISLSMGLHEFEDGGALRLSLALQPLLLFSLFLFGLAGFPPKPAIAGLTAAAILGMAMRFFGLDDIVSAIPAHSTDPDAGWISDFGFRYRLDDLAALVTSLGYFVAGRLVEQCRAADQPSSSLWRHPYLAVGALTTLATLATIARQLLPPLPRIADLTGIYGDYDALIIAGFLAGLLLRHAGIALCFGLFVALVAASNAVAFMLGRGSLSVSLEQPVICLAYGTLGVATCALLAGAPIAFKGRRWVQYGLLLVGVIAIVTSSSELIELTTVLMIAIGGALVALVPQWVRRKLELRGMRITGEGWLPLAAILAILGWIAFNARAILSALLHVAEDWDISLGLAIVTMTVLLHVPAALLAAGLTRCLPKVWRDIKLLTGRS